MKEIIHQDQVGFVLVLQGWLNVRKLVNIMHPVSTMKKKRKHNPLG